MPLSFVWYQFIITLIPTALIYQFGFGARIFFLLSFTVYNNNKEDYYILADISKCFIEAERGIYFM